MCVRRGVPELRERSYSGKGRVRRRCGCGHAPWADLILSSGELPERVLARDPDNVVANLARIELYEEAGLRETSRALLASAIERRPRSVAGHQQQ